MLYLFPPATKFGRVVPKTKFYEHAEIDGKLKRKFVEQIEKIVWSYKLAEETLHIAHTQKVPEIEVFDIYLKGESLDEAVLKTIDRAIPKPILFYLHKPNGAMQLKTAYKRPNESSGKTWVVESYFESEWFSDTEPRQLPSAIDLEKLYTQIIKELLPSEVKATQNESLQEQVEKLKKLQALQKEYERLKKQRDKEKQFNKKVELNEKLHILSQKIETMKQSAKESR